MSKRWYFLILILLFLGASFGVWRDENQKIVNMTAQLDTTIVKLHGEIYQVLISPMDKQGNRYVLFFVSLQNFGAASAVKKYWAEAVFNSRVVDLQFDIVPDSGLIIRNRRFYPMHTIYERTQYPIKKGGIRNGVILFKLKGADKYKDVKPKWHLFFTDYLGKVYEMDFAKSYAQKEISFRFKIKESQPLFLSPVLPVFTGSDREKP